MEKYETGKLYIVKPSIVISDESKKLITILKVMKRNMSILFYLKIILKI